MSEAEPTTLLPAAKGIMQKSASIGLSVGPDPLMV